MPNSVLTEHPTINRSHSVRRTPPGNLASSRLLGIQRSQRAECDQLGPDVPLWGVGTALEVLAGEFRLAAVEQVPADEEVGVHSILRWHPVEHLVDSREVERVLAAGQSVLDHLADSDHPRDLALELGANLIEHPVAAGLVAELIGQEHDRDPVQRGGYGLVRRLHVFQRLLRRAGRPVEETALGGFLEIRGVRDFGQVRLGQRSG